MGFRSVGEFEDFFCVVHKIYICVFLFLIIGIQRSLFLFFFLLMRWWRWWWSYDANITWWMYARIFSFFFPFIALRSALSPDFFPPHSLPSWNLAWEPSWRGQRVGVGVENLYIIISSLTRKCLKKKNRVCCRNVGSGLFRLHVSIYSKTYIYETKEQNHKNRRCTIIRTTGRGRSRGEICNVRAMNQFGDISISIFTLLGFAYTPQHKRTEWKKKLDESPLWGRTERRTNFVVSGFEL